MGVQELRLKRDPVRLPPENSHLLERFAPIETALEERIPGILVPPERVADHPDDGLPVSHGGPPYVASLARLTRRSQAATVSRCTAGPHLPHPRVGLRACGNPFPSFPECPTDSTGKVSSSHLQKGNSATVNTMLTGAEAARIPTATSRNRAPGLTIPFPAPAPIGMAAARRNDQADSPRPYPFFRSFTLSSRTIRPQPPHCTPTSKQAARRNRISLGSTPA